MAKKAKKAKKAAPKKSAKVVPMRKKTKAPRSQVLPGMEQVRNRAMDRICEGMSEVRAEMNAKRGEEQSFQREAIKVMQGSGITAYRHAGVEMVLVPGDAKLRVRTMKEQNAEGTGQGAGAITDALTEEIADGIEDEAAEG